MNHQVQSDGVMVTYMCLFCAVSRGLSDPVFHDAGVCRDSSLFPGDVSGTVHVSGRPRRVEAHTHDER